MITGFCFSSIVLLLPCNLPSNYPTTSEYLGSCCHLTNSCCTGWEKAEAEAASLKIQLDESLRHQIVGEERVAHLNGALKECMQQLRYNRDEQEQRIHDAVMKTSKGFEKSQMVLEEKLAETNKKLGKILSENVHLNKALALKENLIEELNAQLNQVEVDFNALMSRLESTEKDNSSLKYEVRVLGKELEIRNEEREFNCRTADASHKQNLESVKKIAKLESECQRLRLLVRKRLPGPAALAKMKNEVEMLGRDPIEMRRKTNPSSLLFDSVANNSFETLSKKISVLTEQLLALEEENKTLKLVLTKKTNELQFSRNMYARTASKLSQVESRLEYSPKFRKVVDPTSSPMSHEFSYASMSDIGSDDKVSNAESWASALVSELEHFRNERQKGSLSSKTARGSDINLMDDFLEMEKLAVVSVDKPVGGSHASSNDTNAIVGPLETEYTSELIGSEIVPISDNESGISVSNQDIRFVELSNGKIPVWLQDIGNLIMEQNRLTGKKIEEMLEDIRAVLVHRKLPKPQAPKPLPVSSNNSPSNKSTLMDLSGGETEIDISLVENDKQLQAGSSSCIHKMIQLIEGIGLPFPDFCQAENAMCKENLFPYESLEAPAGYMVRVFQWKTSELTAVLQKYVHACYELLNGKADLNKFAQELTSALDWIINHCFSIQDVSCMRDAIRKQFDWDDSRSESEAEAGMMGHFPKTEKTHVPRESFLCFPSATASNGQSIYPEEMKSTVAEENKRLNNEMMNIEYAKKEMEEKPHSATDRSEYLINQLHESEKIIASLQTELHTLKQSKGIIEDEVENQKIISEDLDTQLSVARVELNETCQKFSSLEVELENKNNLFEELEATCVELQLQLERYYGTHSKESTKFSFLWNIS